MKIADNNFSQSALILARSSLAFHIKDESLGFVTVASQFSVFLVEALSSMEHFKTVVVDGSCLNLMDFKTTRLNLLRALIKRHPEVRFLLFSDEDLCVYELSFSNLVVVEEKLSKELLASWVGIHSVN
ncbi:MAG: hypothetical protein HUU57_01845 [Bdellovibrio sp.]|nr:hypothetical protein [Bdellovibrio sp.]